jgi:hypothetical protein
MPPLCSAGGDTDSSVSVCGLLPGLRNHMAVHCALVTRVVCHRPGRRQSTTLSMLLPGLRSHLAMFIPAASVAGSAPPPSRRRPSRPRPRSPHCVGDLCSIPLYSARALKLFHLLKSNALKYRAGSAGERTPRVARRAPTECYTTGGRWQ